MACGSEYAFARAGVETKRIALANSVSIAAIATKAAVLAQVNPPSKAGSARNKKGRYL